MRVCADGYTGPDTRGHSQICCCCFKSALSLNLILRCGTGQAQLTFIPGQHLDTKTGAGEPEFVSKCTIGRRPHEIRVSQRKSPNGTKTCVLGPFVHLTRNRMLVIVVDEFSLRNDIAFGPWCHYDEISQDPVNDKISDKQMRLKVMSTRAKWVG